MSLLIKRYPTAAPWIAGIIAGVLMVLLGFLGEGTLRSQLLSGVLVGAGVFFAIRSLARKERADTD